MFGFRCNIDSNSVYLREVVDEALRPATAVLT
ncbi:Uncharacterised protein [Cedecea neteri]|uniref:Uncharacterized protein n=1 Tax=Cedecea neteri TaxID=158822 RepID=A0A2X2SUT4_9ENTR|nr:Uncharacterised protein [Cedecea neteri]